MDFWKDWNRRAALAGWQNCHLMLSEGDAPLAMAPGFLKSHSYGEYVFDWSWADAWHRSGLEYYKLVTAVPFTPATGPRIWTDENAEHALPSFVGAVTHWWSQRKHRAGISYFRRKKRHG